jgi:hypothetical protein
MSELLSMTTRPSGAVTVKDGEVPAPGRLVLDESTRQAGIIGLDHDTV